MMMTPARGRTRDDVINVTSCVDLTMIFFVNKLIIGCLFTVTKHNFNIKLSEKNNNKTQIQMSRLEFRVVVLLITGCVACKRTDGSAGVLSACRGGRRVSEQSTPASELQCKVTHVKLRCCYGNMSDLLLLNASKTRPKSINLASRRLDRVPALISKLQTLQSVSFKNNSLTSLCDEITHLKEVLIHINEH